MLHLAKLDEFTAVSMAARRPAPGARPLPERRRPLEAPPAAAAGLA